MSPLVSLGRWLATLATIPVLLTLILGGGLDLALQSAWVTLCVSSLVQGLFLVTASRIPSRLAPRALAQAGLVVLGATLGSELASWGLFWGWDLPPAATRPNLLRISLVVSGLVVVLFLALDGLKARLLAAQVAELQAREAALRAELRATQARVQPHFLFNTLNTVACLIQEDPRLAERVVERLAGLFRYALDAGRRPQVPLAVEWEAIEGYLEVEGIRFPDRLRFSLELDPAASSCLVPPFSLQPLVENAVLHGLAPRPGPGWVRVGARRGEVLDLWVEDDGLGWGAATRPGTGTALKDLEERLALLHGPAARLDREDRPGGGARVRITLPIEEAR